MVYQGHICNGRIELEHDVRLPEGASVEITLKEDACPPADDKDSPTLFEEIEEFIGVFDDLPPDASVNLDHYLYGHPKR